MSLKSTTLAIAIGVSCMFSMVACGDDAADGDTRTGSDAGSDSGQSSGGAVKCGTATCEVAEADKGWNAQACCFDAANNKCGVKADHPIVATPDGGTIPIGEAIAMLLSLAPDAGVVNTMPTLECVPKNAPGKLSAMCPTEVIPLDDAALMSGGTDGGADDAGASIPQTIEIPGCCRDDGQCGYMDQATGLGCVKISQSFYGQVLGRKDKSCSN